MKDTIRVLVVARDEPFRQGLSAALEEAIGIAVVGVAGDEPESQGVLDETCCDVILLDVDMPETTRHQILVWARERSPDTRSIVLSHTGQEQQVLDALRHGAMGHVYKESALTEIVCAIHAVNRGEAVIASAVAGCILDKVKLGR
jgi:DNA-binding NarL/FixJ family response regulator